MSRAKAAPATLTISAAAEYAGVSRQYLHDRIEDGLLTRIYVEGNSKMPRIRVAELDEWIASWPEQPSRRRRVA